MSTNAITMLLLIVGLLIVVAIFISLSSNSLGSESVAPEVAGPDDGLGETDVRASLLSDVVFMRKILPQIPIPQARRIVLDAQLERLDARARRRSVQLAVIGEFNSGKSTFINALLGRRLLKSANIPTTARATEIHYGSKLRLTVGLLNGLTASGTESDCSAIAAQLSRFTPSQDEPVGLLRWIEYVTADPDVSRAVEHIRIEVPAQWLSQGICILDTPGVGAGPEYAQHHQGVTEQVLQEQADATIVLIPADSPATRTLLNFLDSTVRPFLDRCIFVITKMDGMQAEERASIVAHVNVVLTKFLGAPPTILEAGSLAVLRALAQPSDDANQLYWCGEFIKLEQFLRDFLSRQGQAIVAEALVRVAHQAINDLNTEVAQRHEQVERQRRALEANSVQRIDQVLGQLRNQSQLAMDRTIGQSRHAMQSATDNFANHSKLRIGKLLDGADWSNLKETINRSIPAALAEEEVSFNSAMGNAFVLLDKQCAESHQVFAHEFEKYYQSLKSSGIAQLHKSVGSIPRTRPYTVGFLQATEFNNGPRLKDWVGMAFSKEKKRMELRSLLFPAVVTHVLTISGQWNRRLNDATTAIKLQLDQAVQLHLQQYTATVNAMIVDHEKALAALKSEQVTMQSHAAALGKRAKRLERIRLSLVDDASKSNQSLQPR